MNAVNASCEECGSFIQFWLSGTPRVCRECFVRLAAAPDAPVCQELVSRSEAGILAAAPRFAYCPKKDGDLAVLLDPEAPLVFIGDERWIFYPGQGLSGSEWHLAAQTYTCLKSLAANPRSGVVMLPALFLINASSPDVVDPLWREPISDFVQLGPACLPPGFSAGFRFFTPVVVASLFRAYLCSCAKEAIDEVAA